MIPEGPADRPLPAAVRALLGEGRPTDGGPAGGAARLVWENESGGLTFEVGGGDRRRFVKWSPAAGIDLPLEAERLTWAARWTSVPRVLESGADATGRGWSPPRSRACPPSTRDGSPNRGGR